MLTHRLSCKPRLRARSVVRWQRGDKQVTQDSPNPQGTFQASIERKNGCKWVYDWFMIATDTLRVTPETLSLVAQIDEFKGAWRALGTLAPERLSVLRRVATIESIASSTRIEGSKLTDREVERLLSNLQVQRLTTRDEQEVAGYAKVMDLVFDSWQHIALTENHIKQLHGELVVYSTKDERHRGSYKTAPNSVVALDENGRQVGVVFETATPFDTPRLMTELISWMNDRRREATLHPLLLIGIWTVVFLEIHPFQDGNGRLSRVLTTLLLLQAGYAYVPYSSLESVIEQSKEAYYLALRQTQGTIRTASPNWEPWLTYFLRALATQVRLLEKKLEDERLVLAPLQELSLKIVQWTREHGRITMADAIRLTGASRNTLKQHFRSLIEKEHLRMRGSGRGVWYELK